MEDIGLCLFKTNLKRFLGAMRQGQSYLDIPLFCTLLLFSPAEFCEKCSTVLGPRIDLFVTFIRYHFTFYFLRSPQIVSFQHQHFPLAIPSPNPFFYEIQRAVPKAHLITYIVPRKTRSSAFENLTSFVTAIPLCPWEVSPSCPWLGLQSLFQVQ